ncbi:hypothetical protein FHR97_000394 [Halomonas stenophila]|uniref:Uncharacterized protein n=1 Tax=Halomonas stenophila TaxID=795312 RepID=A0A7W5EQH5_9GAMM|nr:hypothetical protein [Halomonas stenophila]
MTAMFGEPIFISSIKPLVQSLKFAFNLPG